MTKYARRRAVVAILAGLLCAGVAYADDMDGYDHVHAGSHPSSEFVLFASLEGHEFSAPASANQLNEDANAIGDAVFAINRGRFRLFGEYQLSDEEHDLERFQVGMEVVPDTVVWIGRFHQPASAWNTEHHHGRYLQTAITRPSIELWEDEQGTIPQHLSGMLVDSRRPLGANAGIQLALGVGLGTVIESTGLSEFDLLDPHTNGRRMSYTGRIAFLPDYVGTSNLGLLFAHSDMPVRDAPTAALLRATDVRQDLYGAYTDWNHGPWQLHAAIYDVSMDLEGPGAFHSESFVAGYAQLERQLPHRLTAYAREENSSDAGSSVYVRVNHPDFQLRRATLGLRWDFHRRQALTAEWARGVSVRENQDAIRLQWSAALP
ncbi:MAG: hypothetical protein JSR15_01410 [Proteobacteria bacterium]|nr:hypothetical protein [Pseudomonadota bacterium]